MKENISFMIKKLFVISLLLVSINALAQINLGVKGGMAFGYSGNLKQTITDIKESNAKNNIGWHLGAFMRINISHWFLQPELYYSDMKTEFNSYSEGNFASHSQRLDIPVLAGRKILGIGRIYAGPVFSSSLSEKISLNHIEKTKTDDFALAGQLGTGIDLSSLTFDVRYEFGFTQSQTNFVNKYTNQEFKIEKRPNSLVVSIGYKF